MHSLGEKRIYFSRKYTELISKYKEYNNKFFSYEDILVVLDTLINDTANQFDNEPPAYSLNNRYPLYTHNGTKINSAVDTNRPLPPYTKNYI